MIDVIGAPFDLCGKRLGSRLGPSAVRLAGLIPKLEQLGLEVRDCGDVAAAIAPVPGTSLRDLRPLLDVVRSLRARTLAALREGATPIMIGGEHTLSIGTVGAALEAAEGNLGLLWIDAHADINTPGSSDTGNLHGMPLAALAGMPSGVEGAVDSEWSELVAAGGERYRLDPRRIVWFGLRDADPAERPRLTGCAITMHDIDRHGIAAMVGRAGEWLRQCGARSLWVSFDVDALDPLLAPGTGTGVRGGLTYREAHLAAELIREGLDADSCPYRLLGVDLVETNPLFDTRNETAVTAVEWLASLFGKTILRQ